jgi:hypothetical protein
MSKEAKERQCPRPDQHNRAEPGTPRANHDEAWRGGLLKLASVHQRCSLHGDVAIELCVLRRIERGALLADGVMAVGMAWEVEWLRSLPGSSRIMRCLTWHGRESVAHTEQIGHMAVPLAS